MGHVNLISMFKSEGSFNLYTKMCVKVRIYTKMDDVQRIDSQPSTTIYIKNKNTKIYEMMFNSVCQCKTKKHITTKKLLSNTKVKHVKLFF